MNSFEMMGLASALGRDALHLKAKADAARGKLPAVGGDTEAVGALYEQADLLNNLARAIRAANS